MDNFLNSLGSSIGNAFQSVGNSVGQFSAPVQNFVQRASQFLNTPQNMTPQAPMQGPPPPGMIRNAPFGVPPVQGGALLSPQGQQAMTSLDQRAQGVLQDVGNLYGQGQPAPGWAQMLPSTQLANFGGLIPQKAIIPELSRIL